MLATSSTVWKTPPPAMFYVLRNIAPKSKETGIKETTLNNANAG